MRKPLGREGAAPITSLYIQANSQNIYYPSMLNHSLFLFHSSTATVSQTKLTNQTKNHH